MRFYLDGNGISDDSWDFTHIALHETGHSLGLGHFGINPATNLMITVAGPPLALGFNAAGIDAGSQDGARDLYTIPVPRSLRWLLENPFIGARANPTVTFDSSTNQLIFESGQINFAEYNGGFTQTVDPAFADDPLLGAFIRVTPLTHTGVTPAGLHHFDGGTLTIDNGSSTEVGDLLYFEGDFDILFMDSTLEDGSPFVDSFTIMLTPTINNLIDSALLDELFQIAYGGENVFLDFFFKSSGPDLSIDLVQLTNGFTEDGSIEATYFLGPNGTIPEPATLGLLALGALLLIHRKK